MTYMMTDERQRVQEATVVHVILDLLRVDFEMLPLLVRACVYQDALSNERSSDRHNFLGLAPWMLLVGEGAQF